MLKFASALIASSLLLGCGDDSGPAGGVGQGGASGGQGGADSNAGGTPNSGGTPNVGGGGGDSNLGGMGGDSNAGGAGGVPVDCDPVVQDCGDPVLSKCTLIVAEDESAFVDTECTAPKGEALLGEPCVYPTATLGIDTCASTYCANFGNAGPNIRTCHTICQDDSVCQAGEACIGLLDRDYGVCTRACNPFPEDNCVAGVCTASQTPTSQFAFICNPSQGTTPENEPCSFFGECLPGSECLMAPGEVDTRCHRFCDPAHPCDAGFGCVGFGSQTPGAEAVGACAPVI